MITTLVFVRNFFLKKICLVCKALLLFSCYFGHFYLSDLFNIILYNNLMERFPKTVTIFSIHTALVVDNFYPPVRCHVLIENSICNMCNTLLSTNKAYFCKSFVGILCHCHYHNPYNDNITRNLNWC